MLQKTFPEMRARADSGDEDARAWIDHFVVLGRNLWMKVEIPENAIAA